MSNEKNEVRAVMFASGSVDDAKTMHEAASAVQSMFDEACAAGADVDPCADTERPITNTTDPVIIAVHDIAARHGLPLEDVAEAFLVVRASVAQDEQAAIIVDELAAVFVKAGTNARMPFVDLARSTAETAEALAVAKSNRILVPPAPELVDARGKVIPFRRGAGKASVTAPGTIRVEAGAPAPDLGPEADYSGRVKPEDVARVGAGQAAYHLDTLEALETEAKEADEVVRELSDRSDKPVLRGAPTRRNPATGVLLAMGAAALVAGLGGMSASPAPAPSAPPPRPTTRGRGRTPRMVRSRPGVVQAMHGGACGSAACRTLDVCLCDCRKCRAGCARKAPRPTPVGCVDLRHVDDDDKKA